jgi:hypothetical protein
VEQVAQPTVQQQDQVGQVLPGWIALLTPEVVEEEDIQYPELHMLPQVLGVQGVVVQAQVAT